MAAQIPVKLAADLNRVRQQVTQLVHGMEPEPAPGGPRERTASGAVERPLAAV